MSKFNAKFLSHSVEKLNQMLASAEAEGFAILAGMIKERLTELGAD